MKYSKILSRGLLPLMAIGYLNGVIYTLLVSKESLQYYNWINLGEVVLYLLAAFLLAREKKGGVILVHTSFLLSLVKYVLYMKEDIASEDLTGAGNDLLKIIFFTGLLITNLIYFAVNRFGKGTEDLAIVCTDESEGYKVAEDEIDRAYEAETNMETACEKIEEKPSKPVGKAVFFFRSLGLTVVMVYVILSIFNIKYDWYDFIFALIRDHVKLNLLQEQRLSTAINSVTTLGEVGLAFWIAWAFNKADIITYNEMGLGRDKKPVKAFVAGCLIALVIVLVDAIVMIFQGCKLSVNPIYPRIVYTMIMAVLEYIGVGFIEEITSRGVVLSYCSKHGMRIWGAILSCVYFVGLHFITGAYNKFSQAVFLLACALVYVAIMYCFNNLFVAIGMHMMYDWAVTCMIELTILNSKCSFISVMKMTYWKQTIGISTACLLAALIMISLTLIKRKKVN